MKYLIPKNTSAFLMGPGGRINNLIYVVKISIAFLNGLRRLHFTGPAVCVFGSARYKSGSKYYEDAEKVGKLIAKLGFTTVTGGGPGIMEAANKGAFENGGYSVGCNIILPREQNINPYVHTSVNIQHFFIRKTLLIKYSYCFIIMPGGIGTMDEFFEALTLTQTKKLTPFPIIVYDKVYYGYLIKQINSMLEMNTVSKQDVENLYFIDSLDEIETIIKIKVIKEMNFTEVPKPLWYLFEKRKTKYRT